jgi:hypothetical protein
MREVRFTALEGLLLDHDVHRVAVFKLAPFQGNVGEPVGEIDTTDTFVRRRGFCYCIAGPRAKYGC